jgi:CRP-like cAMP-binding protein
MSTLPNSILNSKYLFRKLSQFYKLKSGTELFPEKVFNPGEYIFSEGQPSKDIYYIKSGWVKITNLGVEGNQIVVRVADANELIGCFSPVMEFKNHRENAIAVESSVVVIIPNEIFMELLKTDNSCAEKYINILSSYLLRSQEQIAGLLSQTVEQRLANFLLVLEQAYSGSEEQLLANGHIHMPKKEIAAAIGTTPESLSRNLAILSSQGIIVLHTKTIELLDKEQLRQIAAFGEQKKR